MMMMMMINFVCDEDESQGIGLVVVETQWLLDEKDDSIVVVLTW